MSVHLQQRAVDELVHEGRYLYPTAVVRMIERFHPHDGPGVSRSVISAYVGETLRRLDQRAPFSPVQFERLLDERTTDADLWLPNSLYAVAPGRISTYPLRWHERLGAVSDPVAYASVIGEDLAAARGLDPAADLPSIPKSMLLDAMTVLGQLERPAASALVTDARLAGRVRVDPFQNPDADVTVVPAPAQSRQSEGQTAAPGPVGPSVPGDRNL